jgi:hypothetical protein
MKLLLVFGTTHNALAAEAAMSVRGVALEVLPTPREISVSCGISIQFDSADMPQVIELAKAQEIKIEGVYSPSPVSVPGKREYIKIWGEMQ